MKSFPTISSLGDMVWKSIDGKIHRGDGKPAVVTATGVLGYYTHGSYKGYRDRHGVYHQY